MSLLLCAATVFEIEPTVKFLREQNLPVEVLVTGVGLTAATYHLTRQALSSPPTLIIQAGVAGSLDQNLPLAQTAVIRNETVGDEGVEENGAFRNLFSLGLARPGEPPFTGQFLANTNPLLQSCGLPVVDGVTVNEISTSKERIQYYRSLGAASESLEGAALHYVGLMEKIPFLQLRSFSNFAGERDKTKWKMAQAIETLNRDLQNLIKKITA
jgi:futalosine hydrolase